jgi:hypothetical protein
MPRKKETVASTITDDAFTEFVQEFKTPSDRAAVILGVARIDLCLYHLLQRVLRPNTSKSDELLEGDSPLSTLSARINVCYRMGLIDPEFARCLHLIRKTRNIFAHETSGSTLNSGSHRDRVRELVTPFLAIKAFVGFRDYFFAGFEGASRDFRAVVALLVLRLEGAVGYMSPLPLGREVEVTPPRFPKPPKA